jgi:APA family basic amino acid/polyamine antiporter
MGCWSDFTAFAGRVKPLRLIRDEQANSKLEKTLTVKSLVSIGVGSVVGAGIFVLTGQAAAKYAGPALSLSFVISSSACFLTGLCYAELSAALPVTGSAYTYTYVMCGEIVAWVVGLCLTLEYLFSAAAVAVGWSGAVQEFLHDLGTGLPRLLCTSPLALVDDELVLSGGLVNLPAMMIITFLAVLLSFGVEESARFNHGAVALKLGVLTTFVMYGIYYMLSSGDNFADNMDPFIPANEGVYGHYGVSGIFRGAGAIFFAYVGFDSVCAMAAECKDPNRDLPRGLFITLAVCTALYILVTLSLCGMMNYTLLDVDSPVIAALIHVDANIFFRWLVEIGSIAGLTSVCLVSLMSQPRLLYAMARDGLMPKSFAFIHPTYHTPFYATRFSGIACALLAGTMPLDFLGQLISFGTLVAFSMVCLAVIRKRKNFPNIESPFTVPYCPQLPIAGIVICVMQMLSLPPQTFRNCAVWLSVGMVYYVVHGRHHSIGEVAPDGPQTEEEPAAVVDGDAAAMPATENATTVVVGQATDAVASDVPEEMSERPAEAADR